MRLLRIIPARAGFTTPCHPHSGCPPDHPRSRGVYVSHAVSAATTGDHPRSRGVYRGAPSSSQVPLGSSPLARGLLDNRRKWPHRAGIIPARAGFTPSPRPLVRRLGDHPRSRGVYDAVTPGIAGVKGSSPLARGLHQSPGQRVHQQRIIPARAGFTTRPSLTRRLVADHPRSRGVYQRVFPSLPRQEGSSPLARGLLRGDLHLNRHPRIIPARAGFTRDRRRRHPGRQDRPRSRGVYNISGRIVGGGKGSSPLARGLPGGVQAEHSWYRIIPARAGFTSYPIFDEQYREDHPRSRGVYPGTQCGPG